MKVHIDNSNLPITEIVLYHPKKDMIIDELLSPTELKYFEYKNKMHIFIEKPYELEVLKRMIIPMLQLIYSERQKSRGHLLKALREGIRNDTKRTD